MSKAVSFDNLTPSYDRMSAVTQLRTEIRQGSLTAIVGPNGAGKSTLLKGVIGTIASFDGSLSFGSVARSDLAYLPQQSDIDRSFPLAVVDLVSMGLWRRIGAFGRLRQNDRRQVAEAIAAVGLEGFDRRPFGSLSGGQLQRTLFARLRVQDAGLVLLDEPFSAIDNRTVADLLDIVRWWHGERRTVFAVLHDHETVRAHFPDTLLLARELVAHGPTGDVLTAENHHRARQMGEVCAGPPHSCGRSAA